ncbi:uncharacterized protein PHACADRAFT_168609 [Phanerochaete carnosa HHB-10118-sp]|uniref:Sphingolipid long chain base-responsive protein LSP1 n=1 Tax=Phanerochaete carnosa (strain HHB-10118-sp) TaxID=650164 RepID=K5WB49_PHACS|nr:uncharacterized protein PHACADRAFT_168609 [Phanerochaete carnosa HHB-10118-sp]EKM61188.1 hypothetical protein PHACADRAFT_168609 [Phanerochaete carnosa HHB-10118-sp]
MSSFFSSLKDKAQSAVNSAGLGRSDTTESSQADQTSSGGISGFMKSHGLEGIHHQLRTMQQQYSSSTTPVQKIVTTAKGIAIDYDCVSRDTHGYSKEMYLWGQIESEDLKDVTDRLAWLSYVHGSLAGTLANKINSSRTTFKHLRDAENALAPRRNIRIGMQNQIAKMEHDQRKDQQQRMAELKVQLQKNEEEDAVMEKDIEISKRKAVRETEREKWEAIREFAEKLSMVAQAALAVVPALPSVPPSPSQPYQGENTTASVRASLQRALDSYSPGNISLIVANPTSADLKHTRSFGETHAQELSRIGETDAESANVSITPPPSTAAAPPPAPSNHTALPSSPNLSHSSGSPLSPLSKTVPIPSNPPRSPASAPYPGTTSPPLNPASLNQAPAPIPIPTTTSPIVAPNPTDPSIKVPSVTPTVAETGVPQTAGPDGPGPASGSLLDKRTSPPSATSPFASLPPPRSSATAEDEKKRLEREERERLLHGEATSGPVPSTAGFESAEDEKKRLEREERERLLRSDAPDASSKPPGEDDVELPPYQEF